MGLGHGGAGTLASPGLPGLAGDALSPVVSGAAVGLTAAIARAARMMTTSFAGVTDAADICMNSKYPPTVTTEAPASAITPEASL